MERIAVTLEIGPKGRVFAQALDWIGWCRAGKDEVSALHQLVIAGPRYASVPARAGLPFAIPPSFETFEVVERVQGTATTDFGAPAVPLPSDQKPLAEADIEWLISLLTACWSTFDDVLHSITADLCDKKPQRGDLQTPCACISCKQTGCISQLLVLPSGSPTWLIWQNRKQQCENISSRRYRQFHAMKTLSLTASMAFHGLRALQCADQHGTRSTMPGNFKVG
jgi:hypothetical protein